MKKIILFAALAAFNYANAQTNAYSYAMNTKKLKENAIASIVNAEASVSAINAKALKNFSKHYVSAAGVQWYELKDKGVMCRFFQKGVLNKAYYNAKGSWVGTIASYEESLLPKNIRKSVNSFYPEYLIKLVDEINLSGYETVFAVHIESLKYLKVLRITTDCEMEVIQEMEKQL